MRTSSTDDVLPHVPPVPVPDDLPPVAARFWRYVQVHTTSDPDSSATPSTLCQKDLARILAAELRTLGLDDIEMDDHGYVYATLPGIQAEGLPTL
ncbi:MAG: peptidase T, partial [Bacteroidota bacterium]